jgi:CBS domain-containing protein
VVTRNATVVEPSTPIDAAVGILIDLHIDMLPVLDQGRVAGIVTTTDFALMLINVAETIERAHRQETKQRDCSVWLAGVGPERARLAQYARKTVGQIMASEVVTLALDQNLSQAIDIMQEHQLRHLPVVDEHGKLAGILSDRDILKNLPYTAMPPLKSPSNFRNTLFADDGSGAAEKVPVTEAMTSKVLTTTPDDLLVGAARLLKRKGFGALPVVDLTGSLVGIVTMLDILRAIRELYE